MNSKTYSIVTIATESKNGFHAGLFKSVGKLITQYYCTNAAFGHGQEWQPHYIYITDSRAVNDGDWYIDVPVGMVAKRNSDKNGVGKLDSPIYIRICASNNPQCSDIPSITTSDIQKWIDVGAKPQIELETRIWDSEIRLKLTKDNCVIPVWDKKEVVAEDNKSHINSIEEMQYDAEELECVIMWLNKLKVPHSNSEGKAYSIIGRIIQLLKTSQQDNLIEGEVSELGHHQKIYTEQDMQNAHHEGWITGSSGENGNWQEWLRQYNKQKQ